MAKVQLPHLFVDGRDCGPISRNFMLKSVKTLRGRRCGCTSEVLSICEKLLTGFEAPVRDLHFNISPHQKGVPIGKNRCCSSVVPLVLRGLVESRSNLPNGNLLILHQPIVWNQCERVLMARVVSGGRILFFEEDVRLVRIPQALVLPAMTAA